MAVWDAQGWACADVSDGNSVRKDQEAAAAWVAAEASAANVPGHSARARERRTPGKRLEAAVESRPSLAKMPGGGGRRARDPPLHRARSESGTGQGSFSDVTKS